MGNILAADYLYTGCVRRGRVGCWFKQAWSWC